MYLGTYWIYVKYVITTVFFTNSSSIHEWCLQDTDKFQRFFDEIILILIGYGKTKPKVSFIFDCATLRFTGSLHSVYNIYI